MKPGVVLPVVLLIGISVLLSAVGLFALSVPAAERGWQRNQIAQREADVRSALELLRVHIGRQRESVLLGSAPDVEPSWILREAPNGLVVLRPIDADPTGVCSPLRAESGRLDIRVTPESWWASVPEFNAIAPNLAKVRGSTSVRSLLGAGVTPEDYATVEPLLTVHAEGPELQLDGRQRIKLGAIWNDDIAARVTDRFGQGAADALADLYASDRVPQDLSGMVRVLQFFKVPVEDWSEILDGFSYQGDVARGRIDLNTAPEVVLSAVPGIGLAAGQIVATRASLSAQERSTIVWPVLRDIISSEDFDECASYLTTRSFRWRVDFEVGLVEEDGEDFVSPPDRVSCVIDLGTPRPSLASWRPMNVDQTVQFLVGERRTEDGEDEEDDERDERPLPASRQTSPDVPSRSRSTEEPEFQLDVPAGATRAPSRSRPPNA
ncbi:MAG: hypothetical protein CMJ28_04835 [Phycisphaerae bacterium]|nr:hypothetical protein [Phycisphaerae bacterium]